MNTARVGRTLLLFQILLWGPVAAVAGQAAPEEQPAIPGNGIIANLGFGVGSRPVAGQLSLWVQASGHSIGVRTASTFDFDIFSPSESEEDFALLYGWRSAPDRVWGRIAAGPAVVRTVRTTGVRECVLFFCSYDMDRESTFGLALQADGVLALAGPIGLGATVFGNVNPASSFVGVTLTLGVGRVGS